MTPEQKLLLALKAELNVSFTPEQFGYSAWKIMRENLPLLDDLAKLEIQFNAPNHPELPIL